MHTCDLGSQMIHLSNYHCLTSLIIFGEVRFVFAKAAEYAQRYLNSDDICTAIRLAILLGAQVYS